MPFEIAIKQNFTSDFTVNLYQPDGSTQADLVTGDTVRVKIGRGNGATPALSLTSDADTANGSSVTFTSGTDAAQVRIAQVDTAGIWPGAYDMEVSVVDNADTKVNGASPVKYVDTGTIHVMPSSG